MDGYKLYIRIDNDNRIFDGYADWQEDKRSPDEILIAEDGPRQFHLYWTEPLTNGPVRNQLVFTWVNGQRVERTQEELDAEWAARPPEPPSEMEQLKAENKALKQEIAQTNNDMVGFQNFIFEKFPDLA